MAMTFTMTVQWWQDNQRWVRSALDRMTNDSRTYMRENMDLHKVMCAMAEAFGIWNALQSECSTFLMNGRPREKPVVVNSTQDEMVSKFCDLVMTIREYKGLTRAA